MRQLRREQGMSAQRLAERCAELGHPEINRDRIASLETRRRRPLTVTELFILSVALNVAPVHVLVSTEDDSEQELTRSIVTTTAQLRAWVRGEWVPPTVDPRRYGAQVPLSEYGQGTDTLTIAKGS